MPFRVLIVSHQPGAAGTLAQMCRLLGWQPMAATSMNDACRIAEECAFDLIVTDHYLPPNNGLSLIQLIRRQSSLRGAMPIIVTTSESAAIRSIQSSTLDAPQTPVEPVTLEKLQAVLNDGAELQGWQFNAGPFL
jgi:DNA-binding response OmpR family regulator